MVPFLIIALAAWYCTRNVADSRTNSLEAEKDYSSRLSDSILSNPTMKDRISELPDDILSHILMPLSLRDVVRLTILSRRWREIWLVLPHIDLDWCAMRGIPKCSMNKAGCDLYVKSVDQVLQCHKSLNILSFRISCCLDLEYASHVHRWLNFVATIKGLESLDLKFEREVEFYYEQVQVDTLHTISSSFLSQFPCLKKLNLETCVLKLQSDFRFNKLKNLSLSYVILEGIKWESLVCCPTIESLRLKCCNLPDKMWVGDNLRHLRSLTIYKCPTLRKIELNASNLNTFEFYGVMALECSLLARAQLENLFVYLSDKNDGVVDMWRGLVEDLSGLKHLILRVEINKLRLPTWPSGLFRSVLWLYLDLTLDCYGADVAQALPHLLICFPMLRKLHMTIPCYEWPSSRYGRNYELPTSYLHPNLREVELYDFQVSWTKFASFLLRSAIVLDRMVITKNWKYYFGWGKWGYYSKTFSIWERLRIQGALYGKALSPRANIVIQ